jgi:HEAT repeat protein
MYRSPKLPNPKVVRTFPENMKDLWLVALQRPEADYQYQAAVTISLAHQEGMKGLELAIEPLLESLERPDQRPSVRLAAAQALVELEARGAAPRLFKQALAGNSDLRRVIEPAMARWNFMPARDMWLERLEHPETSRNDLLLAVRALDEVREDKAASGLEKLVFTANISTPIRLEAARVLGALQTSGQEASARRLLASPSASGRVPRLAAAWLLRHHQGPDAVRLLIALARDTDPLVALIALQRLMQIDRKLVVPFLKDLLASSDPDLRLIAVEVLFREPTLERVQLLGDRFFDTHPPVRIKARQSLGDLAGNPAFHGAVVDQGMRVLSGKGWRELEQAIILLGQLDHKPAALRMVELLTFDRPEVFVAAAWGLRRLAVPETLPAALRRFDTLQRELRTIPAPEAKPLPEKALDDQLSQLAQLFGQARYLPAEPILRQAFPRPPPSLPGALPPKERALGLQARASAVWALGLIHEGESVKDLVGWFDGQLRAGFEYPSGPPDDYRVRWMSAVSLGRMKAKDALGTLRKFYIAMKPSLDPVNYACGWAIEQITGETMPSPGTVELPGEGFKNWLRLIHPDRPRREPE